MQAAQEALEEGEGEGGFDSVLTKTGRRLMMVGGLVRLRYPLPTHQLLTHPQARGNAWCAGLRETPGASHRPSAGPENRDSGRS